MSSETKPVDYLKTIYEQMGPDAFSKMTELLENDEALQTFVGEHSISWAGSADEFMAADGFFANLDDTQAVALMEYFKSQKE